MRTVIKKIYKTLCEYYKCRKRIKEMNRFESKVRDFCINNHIDSIPLNDYQEIYNFWLPLIDYKVKPYYYSMMNSFEFEYPLYQAVNEAIIFPNMIRKLNPKYASNVLANKSLYGFLFKDINRPCELLRNFNGVLLNCDNKIVSLNEGIKAILSYGNEVIIKPTIDTYGGHGVQIISNYSESILKQIFEKYKKDFVVQTLVNQSIQTKQFNPTSLNTFRIITLLLNGKVSVLSSIFRCGGKNAVVDNASSGGMFVGIKHDGTLTRATSYSKLIIDESPEGLKFSNYKIEHFEEVLKLAKSLHTRIPLCSFAGWDIALDVNDNPVFMEVNLNCPDVWLMQILNGPIFRDRFSEVIDFVFDKQ